MNRRTPREGFVLVMALAMIVLAGFLLAGIARHSLGAAVDAMTARRELQMRWGTVSCQRLLLDDADDIFARLQSPDGETTAPLSSPIAAPIEIALGDMTFRLRLADESCKANLSTVLGWRGEEEVNRICRDATSSLRTELKPLEEGDTPAGRAFECWSQVFAADADSGTPPPSILAEATSLITCWGDGRLNIRRAPDETVQTIGRLAVSANALRDLLKIRRQHPGDSPGNWLKRLALDRQAQRKLLRLFGEESRCFSLWIEAASPERTRNEFVIVETSPDEADQFSRFVW